MNPRMAGTGSSSAANMQQATALICAAIAPSGQPEAIHSAQHTSTVRAAANAESIAMP
jgi:hypothetical protein